MTEPWEETFRELRAQFVRGARDRLDRIARRLERLELDPADRHALVELMQEFHRLAGSGGTYGFQKVTALGLEGERSCHQLVTSRATPSRRELETWRSICRGLRRELGVVDGPRGDERHHRIAP